MTVLSALVVACAAYDALKLSTLHYITFVHFVCDLRGLTVTASDLQSSGRGFDSQSGRYQATKVNSAFHPSGVGN